MKIRCALAAAMAAVFLMSAAPAFAEGTGDDPALIEDEPSWATYIADIMYDSYVRTLTDIRSTVKEGDISTQVIIAPYKYFWTPSHRQERDYWCGPASVQIVDDYWGTPATQSRIAYYLGTTTAGTVFSRVDDALRYFTGRSYAYRTCTSTYDVYNAIQYGLLKRGNPAIIDVNIDGGVWDNYVYSHPGHIIPLEAFDWRWGTVRLNDPYDESWWRVGGGPTYGHRTYPRSQVAAGIMSHWRRAIVY